MHSFVSTKLLVLFIVYNLTVFTVFSPYRIAEVSGRLQHAISSHNVCPCIEFVAFTELMNGCSFREKWDEALRFFWIPDKFEILATSMSNDFPIFGAVCGDNKLLVLSSDQRLESTNNLTVNSRHSDGVLNDCAIRRY